MTSKILMGASQVSPSAKARLQGVTSQSYSPAQVGMRDTSSDLGKSLSQFMQTSTEAFSQYNQYRKQEADNNVQKILRTMSPEQIQDARQKGLLLAQDDPFTMNALNSKLGAMESDRIYTEGAQKIADGAFSKREDYSAWMSDRTSQAMASMAKAYGIDPMDDHWKAGWSEDADAKNISMYRQLDSKLEEMTVNKGRVVNFNRVDGITKDGTLSGADRADLFVDFLNKGMEASDGTIRNAEMAKEVLQRGLTNAAADPQGSDFLQRLGDKQISIYGTTTTPREYLGKEQWDVLTAQAEASRYKNDWEFNKGFQNDLLTILTTSDLNEAEAKLNQLEGRVYSAQPSNMVTAQKQDIQNMRATLTAKRVEEADRIRKESLKGIMAANRQLVLQDVYTKRLAGQNISTELDQLPTNEMTGKFSPEDLANYANSELDRINSLPIDESQKDQMKMRLLRIDAPNGPFRKRMETLIRDASQEWSLAVRTGDVSNTPRLDELQKVYKADPTTIGLLYPDQQKLFMNMDLMNTAGFSKETLAISENKRKDLTKQEQIDREKNWTALLNSTDNKDLASLPAQLKDTMYKAYEANIAMTGNEDAALGFIRSNLEKNYVAFKTDGVGGPANSVGVVSKNFLVVNPDDTNSWQVGRDILENYKQDFIKMIPWATDKDVSIVEQGDSVLIKNPYGDAMRVSKEDLMNAYHEQVKSGEDARRLAVEASLKDINKRAWNQSFQSTGGYTFPSALMVIPQQYK